MMIRYLPLIGFSWIFGLGAAMAADGDDKIRGEAAAALRKAVEFYRGEVSYKGAYLYQYSPDLSLQEGEDEAYRTTGWTQPPGTPAVGMAYLDAWRLTKEDYLLEAAREAAGALIEGQLRSGGWDSRFELGEEQRKSYAYRTQEPPGKKNHTTLDDNKSQSALLFLIRLDEVLGFKDERLREVIDYAFEHFLAAQYPNGAWPQGFEGPPDAAAHPVLKASYPESWSRTFPAVKYQGYYTFNDGAMEKMIEVLLEAHRIYGDEKFMQAALRTGDFMLLAQMPEPQPGWAQQYDTEMHPAWARKFEPASISGGESQGVIRALLGLYRETGEERFLKPVPRALEYYGTLVRPDGRLARFYELKTDKGLYFTKEYELTYSDADMPTHYGFVVNSILEGLERLYAEYKEEGPKPRAKELRIKKEKLSSSLAKKARAVIDAMDERGAWVEEGKLANYEGGSGKVISSRRFIENAGVLSAVAGAE